jgi:hypothetical protein
MVTTAIGIVTSVIWWLTNLVMSSSTKAMEDLMRQGVEGMLESGMANLRKVLVAQMAVNYLRELVMLTGYALCCFVPARVGKRRLAVAAVALAGVGMAVDGGMYGVSYHMLSKASQSLRAAFDLGRRHDGKAPAPAEMDEFFRQLQEQLEGSVRYLRVMEFAVQLQLLLHAVQYLVFAYFLLELARALGASGAATNCLHLIKLSVGLLALQVLSQSCLGFGMTKMGVTYFHALSIFGSIVGLLALGQAGWFVVVLYEVRGVVAEQARRRVRRKKGG